MIVLKHSTGLIKECPTGYSWTTFFFGFFVPAFRGDLKWGIIHFLTGQMEMKIQIEILVIYMMIWI